MINLYCDESCHLENDGINAMGFGTIWCDKNKVNEINHHICDIKSAHGVNKNSEIKWTKVGPAKLNLYLDIVEYFFNNNDLHFRGLVIPDKSLLNHQHYNQTHDEWYYKMYFEMLRVVFDPRQSYNVFIDIKDSHSTQRTQKLHDVCCNDIYDFSHTIIKKVQPIRSEEVQIMQLTDILLGALVYINRTFDNPLTCSQAKLRIVERIKDLSGYTLKKTTLLKEDKFNVLIWRADYYGM